MKRITRKKLMTVRWCALIAGHGGSDCGADYAGAYEKMKHCLLPDW